jgi:two-component system LytT family response regulator
LDDMPVIVFVTAYDQYAINAFEVQAVDYLLKPFDQDRFRKSFQLALKRIQSETANKAVIQGILREIHKDKNYLDRIMVNVGDRYFFIAAGDIRYITVAEKYVNLHTIEEAYLIRDTMNRLEKQLDPAKFTRIHRSTIVNVDCIREMQP